MKKLLMIFVCIFIFLVTNAQTKSQVKVFNDKKKSVITYAMHHPLHSWNAESKEVMSIILCDDQKKNISQVAVSAKVASFDSQNANRDSHMIEVTEALKYPNITFKSTAIKQQDDQLSVKGTLNFHGVDQEISFNAIKKIVKDEIEITGNLEVTMTQFNIEPPSLIGIDTDDDIKIAFDIFY